MIMARTKYRLKLWGIRKSMSKGRLRNPRRTYNCNGSKFDSEASDRAPSQRPQNKGITLRTSSDVKTISNFGLYNLGDITK